MKYLIRYNDGEVGIAGEILMRELAKQTPRPKILRTIVDDSDAFGGIYINLIFENQQEAVWEKYSAKPTNRAQYNLHKSKDEKSQIELVEPKDIGLADWDYEYNTIIDKLNEIIDWIKTNKKAN